MITIVVVLVIAAAVLFYVQGRRDRKKYQLLLNQQGKSTEMDDRGNVELDDQPTFVVGEENDDNDQKK